MRTSRKYKFVRIEDDTYIKIKESEHIKELKKIRNMIRKNGFYNTWLYIIKTTNKICSRKNEQLANDKNSDCNQDSTLNDIYLGIFYVMKEYVLHDTGDSLYDKTFCIKDSMSNDHKLYMDTTREVVEYLELFETINRIAIINEQYKEKHLDEISDFIENVKNSKDNNIFCSNAIINENVSLKIDKYIEYEEFYDLKKNKFNDSMILKPLYNPSELNKKENYMKVNNANNFFVNSYSIKAKTIGNLIISMGDSDIRENSLKLHPIYGFPYIPSSAIKGAFKDYIINIANEKLQKQIDVNVVFGTNDNIGSLVFFDAFPTEYKIGVDIVNCHYLKYYSGKALPTENRDLAPVKFYVVEEGVFCFNIAIEDKSLFEDIETHFKRFINYISLGAKKSVGYGNFVVVDE